ncbi:MAG TPA: family 16 glycoside hydrolase [Sedimentisphaerales bacterium]|nr:family 16 glycoside hydrolase [Sedimentisphaerales bacterium]
MNYSRIHWLIALLIVLASFSPLLSGESKKGARERQKDEWTSLFDGKTLNGWSVHSGFAKYHIEDDAIVGTTVKGSPNTFLCTDREYGDFILEFEVRLDPRLNSGVQIRSKIAKEEKVFVFSGRDGKPQRRVAPPDRVYGYQVEIATEKGGSSGSIYDEARRDFMLASTTSDPAASKAFKDGQWNKFRIECKGDRIRTWINDVPCVDLRDGMTSRGIIGLQVHGVGKDTTAYQVRWRNIRIQAEDQGVEPPAISSWQRVLQSTPDWTGKRMEDGRPYVPDDILERMNNVSITQAWSIVRGAGYRNCYENAAGWVIMYPDEAIVGRVLTAQYMPSHPDFNRVIMSQGRAEGRIGSSNSWPIDMLQKGDVYVADCFGKVLDGTLIGDNLGNAIYANSGNGVIFDAGVRDLEGLEEIKGFNAWHKGADPSFLREVMMSAINVPIRIGRALACPGDVVLAKREGIVFIPAHLAEKVVTESEAITLRDMFGHQRLKEGKYTPGQIDGRWTPEIQNDFRNWLKKNIDELPVPKQVIEDMLNSKTRNW